MAVTGYLLLSATGRTITESGGLPWIEGDLGISGGGGGSLSNPLVLIDSDSGRSYGTGSYTTGSSSAPTAGSLLVAHVVYCTNGGGDPGVAITISDSGGHSWSEPVAQQRRQGSGTDWIGEAFFVADNSGTGTFTVTVDTSAGNIYAWEVQVVEVPGGSGASIGATGSVSGTGNGAVAITLSGSPATGSYVLAGLGTYETNDITLQVTEGAGWTESVEAGRSVPNAQVQYRTGSTSTSVDWADNGTTVSGYLGLAFEVIGADGGGDQTWTGSTGALTAAGSAGTFTPGALTWTGSTAAITASGVAGSFTPGVSAWAGSTGAITATGSAGSFTPGASTWTGSTGGVTAAGTAGSFTPGALAWTGSTGAIAVTGTGGAFSAGSITWIGATAAVTATGAAGSFTAGAVTWNGSAGACTITGAAGVFSPGGVTWTSTAGAITVTGTPGEFTAGSSPQTWTGSTGSIECVGTAGVFTPGAHTWTSVSGTITATGAAGVFTPGARTWAGSTGVVNATATSGAFTPGAIAWVSVNGMVIATGTAGVFTPGDVAWGGSLAALVVSGAGGAFAPGTMVWDGDIGSITLTGAEGEFTSYFMWGGHGAISLVQLGAASVTLVDASGAITLESYGEGYADIIARDTGVNSMTSGTAVSEVSET